jgi:hypothetical protein
LLCFRSSGIHKGSELQHPRVDRESAATLRRDGFQKLQAAIFGDQIDIVVLWKVHTGRRLGSLIAADLAKDIQDMGLPAAQAGASPQAVSTKLHSTAPACGGFKSVIEDAAAL